MASEPLKQCGQPHLAKQDLATLVWSIGLFCVSQFCLIDNLALEKIWRRWMMCNSETPNLPAAGPNTWPAVFHIDSRFMF